MNNANLVNQTSAESGFEYYTPHEWTDAAREVMGSIDLDPASCDFANEWIGAKQIFTKDSDGLQQKWHGRVWMNHPFHRGETACKANCKKLTCQRRGHHITEDIPGNAEWISKLLTEYQAGRVTEAVIICYCSSSETWFKPLLKQPQCFPDGRVHYIGEDGKKVQGNTKGSVITYFGQNVAKFAEVFGKLGEVKVAYQPGNQLTDISAALLGIIEQRASELAQQYASATIEQRPDDAEPGEQIATKCVDQSGTHIDEGAKALTIPTIEYTSEEIADQLTSGKLPFTGDHLALMLQLDGMFGKSDSYTTSQIRAAILAFDEPGMVTKGGEVVAAVTQVDDTNVVELTEEQNDLFQHFDTAMSAGTEPVPEQEAETAPETEQTHNWPVEVYTALGNALTKKPMKLTKPQRETVCSAINQKILNGGSKDEATSVAIELLQGYQSCAA